MLLHITPVCIKRSLARWYSTSKRANEITSECSWPHFTAALYAHFKNESKMFAINHFRCTAWRYLVWQVGGHFNFACCAQGNAHWILSHMNGTLVCKCNAYMRERSLWMQSDEMLLSKTVIQHFASFRAKAATNKNRLSLLFSHNGSHLAFKWCLVWTVARTHRLISLLRSSSNWELRKVLTSLTAANKEMLSMMLRSPYL